MRVFTIGIYGWTQEAFVNALRQRNIQVLIDVRQRRGVRGRLYRFANLTALKQLLAQNGIEYYYAKRLAPSRATRQIQKSHDASTRTLKRNRLGLAPAYVDAYTRQVLDAYDWSDFRDFQERGIQRVALMCVEQRPEACHRSLIAARAAEQIGAEVEHITP
ncbi:MAG: DUF488 family protein [Fimbriimonadales bacterium]